MRNTLLRPAKAAAFSFLAVAGLAAIARPAAASDANSPFMNLGAAAPAPPGFLAFCARTPDQCGLAGAADANGQPLSTEQLSRDLYAKYYWSVAFGGGDASGASLTPTSGASVSEPMTPSGFRAQPSASGYDWNAIFGTSPATPAATQTVQ